jgi:hypothetical protein
MGTNATSIWMQIIAFLAVRPPWHHVRLTSVRSAASGFMLAAAVRRAGCRREAGISDGRSATGVTPHWYGSAEVLQHRADTKPLVSCSEKLARQERLRRYSALRRPPRSCSTRAARCACRDGPLHATACFCGARRGICSAAAASKEDASRQCAGERSNRTGDACALIDYATTDVVR